MNRALPAQAPIRVRAQWPDQPDAVWTASRLLYGCGSPDSIVQRMNQLAARQGLAVTYSLASEQEYQQYRAVCLSQ